MNAADWVPVADLVAWDKNPKPHGQDNIKEIARSIRRFDFGAPIVAWRSKRQVVAGHGRLLGASLLMREDPGRLLATDAPGPGLVPVRWMEFASESEAAAYALADNRLTEVNPMTDAAVADILREIEAEGGDVNVPGYSEDDLKALLAPDVADVPDPGAEEPAPQGEPDSKLGEVYELGPHRLVCGDSRDAEAWAALLPGEERLQMVWTDPPYGVDMEAVNAALARAGKRSTTRATHGLSNDALSPEELEQFLRDALGLTAAHCCPGAAWYVAVPQMPVGPYVSFLAVMNDLEVARHMLIWVKQSLVMGRSDYHYRHEPIFYGWTPGAPHYFIDDRTQDSVLQFDRPTKSTDHPTMKPVELVAYCINNSSKQGWVVGEPFGGSGTTLIACAQTGRVARLIEIDPRYCDVIRRRWTKWAREAGVDPGPGRLE